MKSVIVSIPNGILSWLEPEFDRHSNDIFEVSIPNGILSWLEHHGCSAVRWGFVSIPNGILSWLELVNQSTK